MKVQREKKKEKINQTKSEAVMVTFQVIIIIIYLIIKIKNLFFKY
jgi:hypothetical protein